MITSIDIMNYIEGVLNSIAQTNDFDIIFNGGVDIVDAEYSRRMFGTKNTPFSLATNRFELTQNKGVVDFRYSLYIMPYADDREKIEYIMEELYTTLSNNTTLSSGWQLKTRPINIQYGANFSEGAGKGIERFETILIFEGIATSYYTNNDILLGVGDLIIPITSFKFDSGKVSYINKTTMVDSPNAHNINNNMLILQSPLGINNMALTELIGSRQKVNIEKRYKVDDW